MPWPERIDALADKMIQENADVVCLYEIFDIQSGFTLSEKLKKAGYRDFYFNIGPRAIGVSSGIFVASKYSIQDPEFVPFPVDSLVGRTKNATKGVFGFSIPQVRIFATHLQHSEASQFPTEEEKQGRAKQMDIILSCIDRVRAEQGIIVTGDLNLGDQEYQESSWSHYFDKGKLEFSAPDYTWPGDEFCAKLVGDTQPSGALNLDHTLAQKGTVASVSTRLVKTGFDPKVLKREALSDHSGLFTRVCLINSAVKANRRFENERFRSILCRLFKEKGLFARA